jgi:DNA-binding transcriptional MerR regulator
MPKPTKRSPPATGLTAAECARRTGLTVRALRVYERHKLIKPLRSANGWRVYGPDELVRLNSIVALKALGLTLAQIRKAFTAAPPALAEVLDMQMKTLVARRIASDRAIAGLQSTIARVRNRVKLSVDELCNLLRSNDTKDTNAVVRELINEHVTPEQEREWMTYWAHQKPEAIAAGQEQRAAYRAITEELRDLMRGGSAPDSPEVQAVVERSAQLWLRSGLRERQLEQLSWNSSVTRAWFSLGSRLIARSVIPEDAAEAERLREFTLAARKVSKSAAAFTSVIAEARRLRDAGTQLGSPEARALVQRYKAVCEEVGAGDPSVHARWIAAFAEVDEKTREAWDYLAHAL